MNRLCGLLLALALCLPAIAAEAVSSSPIDQALTALNADDAITAEKILRPLAESGNADAQHLLGFFYDLGLAVPMDFGTGNEWQNRAAVQDHYWARLYLGWKMGLGSGLDKPDPVRSAALQSVVYERKAPDRIIPADWLTVSGLKFAPNYRRASRWARPQAEAGNAVAAFTLAEYYYMGVIERRPNPAEHLRWMKASADGGCIPALVRLKFYYAVGLLTEKNEALSREYLARAAAAGDPASAYELGRDHARGQNGQTRDYAKARDWYARAAQAGHLPAINALADLLRQGGDGVAVNLEEARRLSRQAADRHDPEGLSDLASMLRRGQGGPKDRDGAMALYREAADKKYPHAQYMVGWMLAYDSTPPDYAEARPWLEVSASSGNESAMRELGWMYLRGRGVEKNDATAFIWFEKAAREGDAEAQAQLGWMLANGIGIERDEEEAATWLKLAAAQNPVAATIRQADSLREGSGGVIKNLPEAFRLYRLAAEAGDARGSFMVGWMMTYGEAGARDYTEAARWFERAILKDYVPALNQIGLLYSEGRGRPVNQVEAYPWFLRAADKGDSWGQNRVGWMLLNGEGVKRDEVEAVSWFRRAAAQNNTTALINLGRCHENGTGTAWDLVQAADCYRKARAAGQPSALGHLARVATKLHGQEQVALFREITPMILEREPAAEKWELGLFAGVMKHNDNPLRDVVLGEELLARAIEPERRPQAEAQSRPKVKIVIEPQSLPKLDLSHP